MIGPRLAMEGVRMVRSWIPIALVLQAGCFYTDRINSRPSAVIHGESAVYEGDMLMYVASGTDRDEDELTYDFSAWQGGTRVASSSTFMLPVLVPNDKTDIVIRLTVMDSAGAKAIDELTVSVLNRAPVVTKLQVESQTNGMNGYTVGRLLQIRAEFSDPDPSDTVTAAWMHYPTPDSDPGADPFMVVSETSATLRPDAVGDWIVELTVRDDDTANRGETTETLTIRVDPDLDPCLGPLSPPLTGDTTPILVDTTRTFRVVSVIDDLDPYPYEVGSLDADLGRPTFRWFLQRPGGTLDPIAASDVAEYTVRPEAYAPGDELTLRVEVADRTPGWPACPVGEATCASAEAACIQRATWKVVIR
jgi:hypothetical protein